MNESLFMAVARRGDSKLKEEAIKDTETLEIKALAKLRSIVDTTPVATVNIDSLHNDVLNQLSLEEMEIIDQMPAYTVQATLSNDIVRKARTLSKATDTTLNDIIESSIDEYNYNKTQASFNNLTFRSKTLPKCRYNVIMNFRRIADMLKDKPNVESFEALKVIVIALPDVNEKRARQEYLKTLQNYSMRVNGAKQVEILNLVGFSHEIDQIMSKYHGFKVGF